MAHTRNKLIATQVLQAPQVFVRHGDGDSEGVDGLDSDGKSRYNIGNGSASLSQHGKGAGYGTGSSGQFGTGNAGSNPRGSSSSQLGTMSIFDGAIKDTFGGGIRRPGDDYDPVLVPTRTRGKLVAPAHATDDILKQADSLLQKYDPDRWSKLQS